MIYMVPFLGPYSRDTTSK